ncbi:hypothetical protein GCM10010885_13430 [Alicyclobacillus cellulosilyticus]|uniref:Uncharacterized protein n=1 Tax=Alicyclobacillus cellulosilyticus TaxID=1003997 RepID=A0A917K9Q5_9BACL|nr:hypothetical protein [Alicyclobacillus cellulosilyticus]GGJ05602.1 hypothetical protein GCM10010885_13430 [Alicyclobacillus cellulosilyticus]
MLKFLAAMVIPLYVLVYTALYGRWLTKRRAPAKAAAAAYALAGLSFAVSAVIFWRLFTR